MIHQEPRKLSLRRNFAWNAAGVGFYNFSQWLLLLVLARLSDQSSVGQFGLMLAISAPVFLTVGMDLRVVQATDAPRRWRLDHYLFLRKILNAVAILLTMAVGVIVSLVTDLADGQVGWFLFALGVVSIAKSVEGSSQVYYGYFQLRERLDLVTRSLLLRAVAGPSLFLLGFATSGRLAVAAMGLVVGWGAAQLLVDRRNARTLALEENRPLQGRDRASVREAAALARKAAPLGIDAGVSSLAVNIPRYAITFLLGVGQLGVFASQAYLAQVISMITNSLSTVFVPRLAVYFHDGRRGPFVRMLGGLILFGVGVLVVGVLIAFFLGDVFIRFTLGPEYVNRQLLIALMASAGVSTLQRNMSKGLVASHRFSNYLLIDTITVIGIAASAIPLIQTFGVIGGAYSLVVGFGIGCLAVTVALARVLRGMPQTSNAVDDASRAS